MNETSLARLPSLLPILPALIALTVSLPLSAAETSDSPALPSAQIERQREAAFEFARAKLLAEEGSFEKALKAYERVLELDGSDPYSQIEIAKLHSYLAQISRSAGRQLENLERAAEYAGEARRIEPENLEILQSYAQIHLRLGEHQLTALDLAQEAYEELRGRIEGDLQVLTSLGQIYLWKQQAEKAAEVLEEAVSFRPGHRMIQTMLLDALVRAERHLDAEEVLRKLLEIDPASLEHRMRLAESQSRRGDHRVAAATLSAAPEEAREDPRLQQLLAQELHLGGANEDALALTDALGSDARPGPRMRRLRVAILSSLTRYRDAIDELEPLLAAEQDADRQLQDALLLSRLMERIGRLDDAAQLLRRQVEAAEAEQRLQLKLALVGVLERLGDFDTAVDLLRRETAAADEHLPMLSRALSELLGRLDRGAEAMAVLDDGIARLGSTGGPEATESLALRRLMLLAAEEDWPRLYEQAPALFDAALPEVRSAAEVLYAESLAGQDRVDDALEVLAAEAGSAGARSRVARKAELLHRYGREAEASELLVEMVASGESEDRYFAAQVYQRLELYSESVPLLEGLLEEQADSVSALFLLGAAYERSGEQARATGIFQRLLEQSPDHTPTLNYLGYMWADLGENLPEAVGLILRAVALDPDNGAYVDSLGWAYFQLGRYQEARDHLEWAARLTPDDATILEHLGDLYLALKDVERARASYRQALDLGGDTADALRRKLKTLEEEDL